MQGTTSTCRSCESADEFSSLITVSNVFTLWEEDNLTQHDWGPMIHDHLGITSSTAWHIYLLLDGMLSQLTWWASSVRTRYASSGLLEYLPLCMQVLN